MEIFDRKYYLTLDKYSDKEEYIKKCIGNYQTNTDKLLELEFIKSEISLLTTKRELTNGFTTLKTEQVLINDEAKIYKYILFKIEYLEKAIKLSQSVNAKANKDNIPNIGGLINLNTNKLIIDAYYNLTIQPKRVEQIPSFENFIGNLSNYYSPFVCVFGAYPLKHDYELLQVKIKDGYFKKYDINDIDIERYLKKYAEGFKEGYAAFEDEIVKSQSGLFEDKEAITQKVFDYATGNFFYGSGFPESHGNGRHLFSEWKDAGKEQGYFYRAWCIMILEHTSFQNIFESIQSKNQSFISLFLHGINILIEKRGNKETFIKNIDKEKDEAGFRNWFSSFFQDNHCKTFPELNKGTKRIDLVVENKRFGKKKIEFKDWRNEDKDKVVQQLCEKYLTPFDSEGYIFLINPNKSSIVENYKKIITSKSMKYAEGTWDLLEIDDFTYFVSSHKFGAKEKLVYHIIIDIYP